ncbi:MAG TPA: hypothetical protein VGD36_15975, partial [Xanthobacteraceae bacterium]
MQRLFLPTARETNVLLIVGFLAVGCGLYVRYLVIEQSTVGLACEAGLQTWLCFTRRIAIMLFTHTVFGIVALAAVALHLIRPGLPLMVIALAAGGLGLVLYNVETSA